MTEAEANTETLTETELPARRGLGEVLLGGSSALGVVTLIERGLGFLANLAAARVGGPQVFGTYSIAMTTATNVASYAGAGIGTTANRFSGEYPYGKPGYDALLRSLSVVCLSSSALAAALLWFAAEPLATYLLRNPGLTHLLRVAALSASVIILLECLRGLLVGQRKFGALLALCILSGGGLLAVLPIAAKRGALAMVTGQAVVVSAAIVICVLCAKQLGFAPPAVPGRQARAVSSLRPATMLRFSMVQLAGMIGINAAGWWIASLVARADISLVQVGWYSVATQLRNVTAMPPWLISQTAYAQLTEGGGAAYGGAGRVTLLSTIAATVVSLVIAGPAAALMPWLVPHLFGKGFAGAELAATLAVATGLAHMSSAPASARLTVVSLPATGIINGVWTVLVVGLGTWLVPKGGAVEATASFLGAHFLSGIAVLVSLLWLGAVPRQHAAVSMPGLAGCLMLAGLGFLRSVSAYKASLSVAMVGASALLIWLSLYLGSQSGWNAKEFAMSKLFPRILGRDRGSKRSKSVNL